MKIHTLAIAALMASSVATPLMADSHEGGKHHQKKELAKKMMKHRAKHIFSEMDANSDGKISAEEHANHFASRFKAMDANGDGFVTEEEGKEHRQHMRDTMKERMKKHREKRDDAEGEY